MNRTHPLPVWLLAGLLAVAPALADDDRLLLPSLGDGSSGTFSSQQEYELGRAWLKMFRGQVRTVSDPLMQDYLENLIYKLASHSQLSDRRLEVVVVDNPTINAFAVPGGVIGVHNGLFLTADTEAQIASVLGHELAHLSQRHFARGVEAQQRAAIPTLAGLLGALVLAATVRGDAGIAAMTATQAAAQQNQLRFSRQNEQEADRFGMETLVKAGYDPNATAAMFQNMMAANRYIGRTPPEFLLTHPLTESRVSDARNRAREHPRQVYVDNLDFQLMRARAELQLASNTGDAIRRLRARLDNKPRHPEADRYGLALAHLRAGQPTEARAQLAPLLAREPRRLVYLVTDAEIDVVAGRFDAAITKLERQLRVSPGNHPLTMAYADALMRSGQPQRAESVLEAHTKRRPGDPDVWYQLAEVNGLAGNIVGVHRARAEFFVLSGSLDRAERQLGYALPLVRGDNLTTNKIEERIREIKALKVALERL